ncbi:SDR family NAD(P)-dependent oxidoreductase [Corallococcus sp. AB032C]|uniref:oxidoreductase n=1 Tax=Corallococcus TaxID=83461 RepID=UPI000ECE67B2|nr:MULTISPECIES: oxidoreductase [Corallococcus]NPC47351.1 SDR family NAD(P)-dependent oxidoreductase [Corallococcus exiguus]RKH80082.1 SDR family NAD(P)-dependent oxidoreductase [Corallococcus sp. AB032C]
MTTKQLPLNSGFGATTTAREALGNTRLDGTVAIVTGGYAGIGLETTRTLHAAGATVIVPARTPDKARAALAGLERVELEPMDLFDPASIDAFASRFIASGRPLHLLINNAGIMATPLARDARGFESQFATNHLGHFQLTARLWPALKQANGARVVCLSSRGHFFAGVDFDDPFFQQRPYDKWVAYGQSKTANILFAVGLDARGQAHGVRAFAVHPGGILTDLARHMSEEEVRASIENSNKIEPLKTVEQGAATTVWCATSPQLAGKGGVYCENVDIAVMAPADAAIRRGVKDWAVDPKRADQLWSASEAWTGVRFNP